MDIETVRALNNLSPGNQVYQIGNLIRQGIDGFEPRNPDLVRFVDNSVDSSGDGKTREKAFKRVYEGIEWLNTQDGKGAALLIAPGFYLEAASNFPVLTSDDCLIKAIGNPDDTVLFGSGTDDTVDAATDNLLKIKGGNNIVLGLSLFCYKNTKSAIYIDDTGGGYNGSFNTFINCFFSRLAADGQLYGVHMDGGNYNNFIDCWFTGACKNAGIYIESNDGNPSYNRILGCHFIGTGTDGILIDSSAYYSGLIDRCVFQAGSYPTGGADSMTNGVHVSATASAGDVIVSNCIFSQAAAAALNDQSGASVILDRNNATG